MNHCKAVVRYGSETLCLYRKVCQQGACLYRILTVNQCQNQRRFWSMLLLEQVDAEVLLLFRVLHTSTRQAFPSLLGFFGRKGAILA